ncbi:hypothetical protein PTKIN_Ptkin18bG0094100 [Pterospermum kingtungense]
MGKSIRYMQNLGEVAPALLISQQKPSSFPRLETIAEEECGGVRVPKRIFLLLPLLNSMNKPWFQSEYMNQEHRNVNSNISVHNQRSDDFALCHKSTATLPPLFELGTVV